MIDGAVTWFEGFLLVLAYFLYVYCMMKNEVIVEWIHIKEKQAKERRASLTPAPKDAFHGQKGMNPAFKPAFHATHGDKELEAKRQKARENFRKTVVTVMGTFKAKNAFMRRV